jgi:hypothetical protein
VKAAVSACTALREVGTGFSEKRVQSNESTALGDPTE